VEKTCQDWFCACLDLDLVFDSIRFGDGAEYSVVLRVLDLDADLSGLGERGLPDCVS
jgi:hypothetical protein